ncbi:hypothetical protein [Cryptosporangium sp. NPDC051539]|uniref:hypothetical protein n=1 Tax=Cryptosporangium sp. NPDC051539 TaxID=3363962 RepID=UPI00379D37FC
MSPAAVSPAAVSPAAVSPAAVSPEDTVRVILGLVPLSARRPGAEPELIRVLGPAGGALAVTALTVGPEAAARIAAEMGPAQRCSAVRDAAAGVAAAHRRPWSAVPCDRSWTRTFGLLGLAVTPDATAVGQGSR